MGSARQHAPHPVTYFERAISTTFRRRVPKANSAISRRQTSANNMLVLQKRQRDYRLIWNNSSYGKDSLARTGELPSTVLITDHQTEALHYVSDRRSIVRFFIEFGRGQIDLHAWQRWF